MMNYTPANQTASQLAAVPQSGIRNQLDGIRELTASLGQLRSEIEMRITPVLAGGRKADASGSAPTLAPSCDLDGELSDIRRTLDGVVADYMELLERVRL